MAIKHKGSDGSLEKGERNKAVVSNRIFEILMKAENYLLSTSQRNIFERLAYYLSEINVMHPFREGNDRSQRMFIEYLALIAGYRYVKITLRTPSFIRLPASSKQMRPREILSGS